MKSYTIDDLQSCFVKGNISTGDLVMVHSSLLGLGRLEKQIAKDVPAVIGRCLRDVVGSEGTIVVPTFSFEFCRGKVFDRQNTPSEKMGALSEWFRNQPDALRSKHPIQSVAAIGPLAKEICEVDTSSAFDLGGTFDQLIKQNAKLVLLGTSLQAASIIHFSEQHGEVPYRYWKNFSGPYRDLGQQQDKTYRMYVRNLEIDPQLIMKPIEDELIARDQIQLEILGAGYVRSCSFRNLVAAADDCLKQEPWCLVAGRNT